MRAISNEKRELILSARSRGEHPATIALWLGVAVSSVYNICSLQNKLGSIEPKPFTGRRTILTSEQLSQIRQAVELQNDITLDELITKLDLPIKKSRLSTLLISMGLSFKKRLSMLKSNNDKMFRRNEVHGNPIK